MQVSCSENLLSETIAIHWRTKDESQKSISSSQMIYFYKSHSDAVLRQFLQFLSTFYKKLFEDCSFSDSTNSKRDDIWMRFKLVKWSLIIWRNEWLKSLFFVILIRIERLFLKQTHSTTSTMTYFLSTTTKKHCIQWSTTARIWVSLSAITRSMTRNY